MSISNITINYSSKKLNNNKILLIVTNNYIYKTNITSKLIKVQIKWVKIKVIRINYWFKINNNNNSKLSFLGIIALTNKI